MGEIDEAELVSAGQRGAVIDGMADGDKRTVQAALQNVVTLMAGAGAIPNAYSVAPLFNSAEAQRYNTILKEVSQNG